eukprot:TRINITY_DN3136_c0_g1_i1.p2 TRINITY_DN3136_c0_g1~~TRINITY_DN3136_c0_g1_i1.p2  ORF type:complete len:71 (+),score=15.18 TRINITY_DN3136_c0_g1_i1:80-292(+)
MEAGASKHPIVRRVLYLTFQSEPPPYGLKCSFISFCNFGSNKVSPDIISLPHVLCVDTGRSSETAKAHRG